ncbi:MAG: glycoside hydrolase family 3 N-terminal domain-containing protein [Pseudomonadota bacterium]
MDRSRPSPSRVEIDDPRVTSLLGEMTLTEKIGQLHQINAGEAHLHDHLAWALREGRVGSVINEVEVDIVNEMQRMAVEESRLGVPLLIGRDVIHGFKTVMPIPLAQAASWDPPLVQDAARIAAREAAASGVNWTFSPMLDVSRDPRWGRIAESFGEDPTLAGALGAAMVRGYQGDSLANPVSLAACAKHFAGYGAVEGGRDYAATNVPENELRNVYLPPFQAAVEAGVATLMTSFSDIDGVPATANRWLLRTVLRDEWGSDAMVVSDWDSVRQLAIHGLAANDRESAYQAITAGVDMEMHGEAYVGHLEALIGQGVVALELIDQAVARILALKYSLHLFDRPYTDVGSFPPPGAADARAVAKRAALESAVLVKNASDVLPLNAQALDRLAVIGPLADAAHDQLGTWIFDGDPGMSITPLQALRELVGDHVDIAYEPALATSRDRDMQRIETAATLARQADAVVVCLGEEAILSGEAHCRADIDLPGAQTALVRGLAEEGRPVIGVIMAGRPLTLSGVVEHLDAVLIAWHGGAMAGPAIAELLFGHAAPSGKLPASFPRMVGQVPIYHSHKRTGKPPSPETIAHIDDIDPRAPQLSLGMTSFHLDAGYTPLFPFGYGLTYTTFTYHDLRLEQARVRLGEDVVAHVELENTGSREGVEVVQWYVRDLVGSVTRPVRELKAFERVHLAAGERRSITCRLTAQDLAFAGRDGRRRAEAGEFHLWVGGDSQAPVRADFWLEDD